MAGGHAWKWQAVKPRTCTGTRHLKELGGSVMEPPALAIGLFLKHLGKHTAGEKEPRTQVGG